VPRSVDLALLVLRVWIGFSLFLRHGWEKIATFSQMAAHFPDPLGIGSTPSLVFALLSDAICSILVILRVATLLGQRSGETPYLCAGACLALFLAGAGRYSIDALLGGSDR
jgi:putative oxidoreductase